MDPKTAQNFLNNILSEWINPEIASRTEKQEIPSSFVLNKAQIIFTLDGKRLVRLNGEIHAKIQTNTRKIEDMNTNMDDTQESIERLDRIQEEEDFGHVTLVKVRDLWVLAFDFRYGTKDSQSFFQLGDEFLAAATHCIENKQYQAAASNLFVAIENFMKARVLLYPDQIARKSKTHGTFAGRVNIHARDTKIIKAEHKDTYNFLKELYDKGIRYIPGVNVGEEELLQALANVQDVAKDLKGLYTQAVAYKE